MCRLALGTCSTCKLLDLPSCENIGDLPICHLSLANFTNLWCIDSPLVSPRFCLQSEREDADSAQRVKDHTQTLTTFSCSITSEDSSEGLGALPSAAQVQHHQHAAQIGAMEGTMKKVDRAR